MESNQLKGAMIYTNNQGPQIWVRFIKNYFESKIHYPLFIHIIAAFKVNGKIVEVCRSCNMKTLDDLFHCTKLPRNTQICYLDDIYYPEMNNENVYYIQIKPYIHDLSFEVIVQRFISSEYGKTFFATKDEKTAFVNYINNYMFQFQFLYIKKSKEEYEIDKIVTKKTMIHLQTFFNKNNTYPTTKYKQRNLGSIRSHRMRNYNNKTKKHS